MESSQQPRFRLGGVLVAIALVAVVAVVWGAVAPPSASGWGSGSTSADTGSFAPVASYYDTAVPAATPDGSGRDCPDHDGGGSTAPSTPTTPSTTTTDGSTNPSL